MINELVINMKISQQTYANIYNVNLKRIDSNELAANHLHGFKSV